MIRERSVDLIILLLNVVAILVLVGILSVMMNTANARNESASVDHTEVELVTPKSTA
jgi:flagellar basal body-associated protein FliL